MRLDVAGDNLMERLGLALGLVPQPLVQVSFGSGYLKTIVAAVRLGVFEALAEEPAGGLAAADLAARTGCHPSALPPFANALCGMGLLRRRAGRYLLAPTARRWLLASSRNSLAAGIRFLGYCHEMLGGMEEGLRTGEIRRLHDREHPPEFWEAYMGALAAFARMMGGPVTRKLGLRAPRRALDVGGGHGLYSAALCRRFPDCQGTVIDLRAAAAVGRRIIEKEGLADRISFVDGDFRTIDWGSGYDAVLIFHVLHNATEPEARALVAKAFQALNPGGTLAVYDGAHPGGGDSVDMSAGWNELFFYFISGAQLWPEATLAAWMLEAGFAKPRVSRLLAAPELVMTARKPA
jgi:ubiquinone/menaquinone biosynthesis C-methylase UbiE